MSSSKKSLLKSARECLASKNYSEALARCKEVIAEDKTCYDAFVLVGKAAFFLKEYQQAEAAYKRASSLDASSLMAWQGFAELYSETGQWANAAAAYATLVKLTSASSEETLSSRAPQFLRKQADSAARAGSYAEAEACYKQLLAGASQDERLELLCQVADVQLGFDRQEVESRVQARMDEATAAGEVVSEAILRQAVEAEWAEEGLEMETDHASATLREILSVAAPSPRYIAYYDAYLRRLRKYTSFAPPGSMERHNRRIMVLHFCKLMIKGQAAGMVGGCCSSFAFETALEMLEVEGEVALATNITLPHTHPASDLALNLASLLPTVEPTARGAPALALADSDSITQGMAHAFPWSHAAGVHLALALRRRGLRGTGSRVAQGASAGTDATTTMLDATTPGQQQPSLQAATRRRFLLKELLAGLKHGVRCAAGWLAAADLLLEQHAEQLRQQVQEGVPAMVAEAARSPSAQAALDAAKQGLRYVAHRDFLGKEHMEQAGLLLRLAAARALLALGAHPEAQSLLHNLSERVSEGRASFGILAGMPPVSISQQAVRLLAQSALAAGDGSSARRLYEGLVGSNSLGRSAECPEPWLHAEYGWMMMEEGEVEVARQQLEQAVHLLEQQQGDMAAAQQPGAAAELAAARLKLGQVYWALGGEARGARGSGSHAAFLAAAAAPGPHQAEAFSWLGRWYWELLQDEPRARKCYQRALALDPVVSEQAGRGLVRLLTAAGQADLALDLCTETLSAHPAAHWASCCLAHLQLAAGQGQAAVTSYQLAIRASPGLPELWCGLATAYQGLGRHTAALKSFGRALELEPAQLYCLLQSASIHQQLGALPAAAECYRRALLLSPGHPVALLGGAEARLASAQVHRRMGAMGLAAVDLEHGLALASECAGSHGWLVAAWKLVGDLQLAQATVTPLKELRDMAGAAPGRQSAAAAEAAVEARMRAMRSARLAYCKGLHLDPTQGLMWGDAAVTAHQEATLAELLPEKVCPADLPSTSHLPSSAPRPLAPLALASPPPTASRLLSLSQRLIQAALHLVPGSDWLWACAGVVSGGRPSVQEYCWSRAVQLNPKRASAWAALGRLYAQSGDGPLARMCFERARSHEPTSIPVWEAMGFLSSTTSLLPGDASYCDMMEAHKHAVQLGGGLESRLAVAADEIKKGGGHLGTVLSCATQCTHQLPTSAAAHNSLGLAAEARGHVKEAAAAFETALALLPRGDTAGGGGGGRATAGAEQREPVLLYLGTGPGSSNLQLQDLERSLPAGSSEGGTLRTAVRLNLARALAKLGQQAEPEAAKQAVLLYRELQREGAMEGDALAWVSFAGALEKAGGPDHRTQAGAALREALEVAARVEQRDAAAGEEAAARRLSCALPLCKHLVQEGSWTSAHRLVQEQSAGQALGTRCSSLAMQMWLALLAGVVSASTAPGAAASPVPDGLVDAVSQGVLSWAEDMHDAVDVAEVRSHVCSIKALGCVAAGRQQAGVQAAAAAVHFCPWDSRWRLHLASCALSACPSRALAASRATPQAVKEAPPMWQLAVVPPPVAAAAAAASKSPTMLVAPAAPSPAAATTRALNPSLAPCHPGDAHVLRASGLVSTLPLPHLQESLGCEVSRLTRVVHCHPDSAVAWYLLALVSLQQAAAVPGAQSALYRKTSVRCKAALARATALHRQLQAASPPPPAVPQPTALPGMPLAMMVSAAAAAAAAAERHKRTIVSRDQQLAASLVLRLLCASSECHLHTRLPDSQQQAKEAATQAVQWAKQHDLSPALATHQMGRVLWATGDASGAGLALSQAAQAAEPQTPLALLDYADLLSSSGQQEAARQLVSNALRHPNHATAGQDACLLASAALLPVKLLMDLQDLDAASQLLMDGLLQGPPQLQQPEQGREEGKLPPGAVAAALALQARLALGKAQAAAQVEETVDPADGGPSRPVVKQLVLEARWAAAGSVRELQSSHRGQGSEAAFAHLLVGQAEVARGKPAKAIDEFKQAIKLWDHPTPPELLAQYHTTRDQSSGPCSKAALASAVHARPWNSHSWQQLRVVADA